MGILRAYTGGFRGAGHTLTAAAISIAMFAVIRLPVAWVFSQNLLPFEYWFLGGRSPQGIWFAFAISNIAAAVIAFLWFERGTWRDADLTEDEVSDADAGTEDGVTDTGTDEPVPTDD
jgi:Na+-driven multidrug efflux pump